MVGLRSANDGMVALAGRLSIATSCLSEIQKLENIKDQRDSDVGLTTNGLSPFVGGFRTQKSLKK